MAADVFTPPPPPRGLHSPSASEVLSSFSASRKRQAGRTKAEPPIRLSGTRREHHTACGGIEITIPASEILVLRAWGHFDAELSERTVALAEPRVTVASHSFVLFLDLNELESYDSAARVLLTNWLQELRPRAEAIHVSTRSRLVSMGVAVANLALEGGLLAYGPEHRSRYDAVLQQTVQRSAARS
ncbi:hypothetical protein [Chondromyces crocatus]|uniref:STAS domain-containing protein n=1 Tax=Chondromyces crocatus TaxID=52 RepID=A0A0K1EJC4_CHOCO|nr:hypothetical protein [Chondromyces crocatus]AKT40971.1 uncharacterized protein CMC5_051280 [Chondromyces crocatus]